MKLVEPGYLIAKCGCTPEYLCKDATRLAGATEQAQREMRRTKDWRKWERLLMAYNRHMKATGFYPEGE